MEHVANVLLNTALAKKDWAASRGLAPDGTNEVPPFPDGLQNRGKGAPHPGYLGGSFANGRNFNVRETDEVEEDEMEVNRTDGNEKDEERNNKGKGKKALAELSEAV